MRNVFLSFILIFSFTASVSAQTFSDVAPNAWQYPYVEDLVGQGIIDDGYMFHPERDLTRAELVKIMVLATTGVLEDQIPFKSSFPDVDHEAWFSPYVETAKVTGIIQGYPDGLFRPEQTVNRAEAAKIIIKGLGIATKMSPFLTFRDYPNDAWFHMYVLTAFNNNILTGQLNDQGVKQMIYGPADAVSRGEMAKLLSKGLITSSVQ